MSFSSVSSVVQVMEIQQRLDYLGYTDASTRPLPTDGVLSAATNNAIGVFSAPDGSSTVGCRPCWPPHSRINSVGTAVGEALRRLSLDRRADEFALGHRLDG